MIYIFEDHSNADISRLFKAAYDDEKQKNFIYAEGNGNLADKAGYYLANSTETIVVFMDAIPDNKECYRIYREISCMSKRNGFRIVLLPIVCAEYYMIKSIRHLDMFADLGEVDRCIAKIPHITSKLMSNKYKARYCRNFEKYCKYIIRYNVSKTCIKPYNIDQDINGEFYKGACTCQKSTSDCVEEPLSQKAERLLLSYKYVPSGSIATNVKNLTEKEIWDVHRKLVDEYNDFVNEYIAVNPKELNKYHTFKYIK